MDPLIITGGLAVVFAVLALLAWRRAADLEDQVRELRAKLAALESTPKEASGAQAANDTEPAAEDERDGGADEVAAAPAAPTSEEVPPPAAPTAPDPDDPLRLEAMKVVTDAFELARYLDFDAIVEAPSTYRVTVPITVANGNAVRYLEDGMFPCLKHVRIEDGHAVLYVDTSKGPP